VITLRCVSQPQFAEGFVEEAVGDLCVNWTATSPVAQAFAESFCRWSAPVKLIVPHRSSNSQSSP